MNNLFSSFDPSVMGVSLNWLSSMSVLLFIPSSFWLLKNQMMFIYNMIMKYIYLEFKLSMGSLPSPGVIHMMISLFMFIIMNNILGLIPYVFTSSSHPVFTLSLSLMSWVGFNFWMIFKDISLFLSHLVPAGTPMVLTSFMVMIELISNSIRPLTLAIRLAANMMAGHLLLTLVGLMFQGEINFLMVFMVFALAFLVVLELGVSLVQAFVFSTLSMLYVVEVNSPRCN